MSRWDLKLISAYYLAQAFEVEGYPAWVEESNAVFFEAKKKVIRSIEAVEKAQYRDDKARGEKAPPLHGVRYYAEAKLKPGAEWPRRDAWLAQESPADATEGAVGVTEDRAAARRRAAEERFRARTADPPQE